MDHRDDAHQIFADMLSELAEFGDVTDQVQAAIREGRLGDVFGLDLNGEPAPAPLGGAEDGFVQMQMAGDDARKAPVKKCCPDVSDWFRNEMERHRQNLDKVRASLPPILWLAWVWKKGMSIQYKSMDFNSDNCPSGCDNSVWLCGHCVDRSELGNIILGFWVAYLGFSAGILAAGVNKIGSKKPGEGADDPTDASAIGLGHAMGVKLRKARDNAATPDELKTEGAFCKFLNEGIGHTRETLIEYFKERVKNWEMWVEGWSEPFKHMTKGHGDCEKCDDVWKGDPHPLPSPKPKFK